MKLLFRIIFIYFLICSQVFAIQSENIVTDFIINDTDYREIELVLTNEAMYLPCKQLLDMFDIPLEENHLEKKIWGKSISGKNFIISANEIIFDGEKLSSKAFYVKEGLFPETKDEFFVEASVLSEISGENISSDMSDVVVYLYSDKFCTVVEASPNSMLSKKKIPKAYEDVSFPESVGAITLDSVELSNNTTSDSTSQAYRDKKSSTFMFNNNTRFVLKGKLYSGDYKVDMASNNYTGELFSFNGLGLQYKNKYDIYNYSLGKLDSWKFDSTNVLDDILGFSFSDSKEKCSNYKKIDGFVGKKSLVKVYINDDFEKVLDTYGGYYTLKNVFYDNKGEKVEKVKIEEILPDETTKIVLEKNFSQDPSRPLKGEVQNDFILGYSGLQNRLWSSNGYIYESNTKKFVSGVKYKIGIRDNLTFENFVLTDKIMSMPENYTWGESLLQNRNYLNFYNVKNPNMLEGQTYMGALDYKVNDKFNARFLSGVSNSISCDSETDDGRGFSVDLKGEYAFNKQKKLTGGLFYYSPDFYMAGSSGSSSCLSDRVGARISGATTIKKASFNGAFSRYNTNLNDFYDGGNINFSEYRVGGRIPLGKFPSLRFRYKSKVGANKLGEISSDSFDLSAVKNFRRGISFDAGIRGNNYSNFYASDSFTGYKSKYSNIYIESNYNLPKSYGSINLKHEAVETKSDDNEDSYNVVRVGYSFPLLKRLNLSTSTGYHYTGKNKGFDFGAGLTYRMKSGSAVSLNYRFNRSPGYLVDSMFLPSTMRHYITMDFSEIFGVSDGSFHSVGMNNFNKGYVEAVAFLDVNKNGVFDENELEIEGVPIIIADNSKPVFTDEKGCTGLNAVGEGIHNVKIFEDELPAFLSYHSKTNPKKIIKVSSTEKTKVYFGFLSSVGNISGTVIIEDEFGRRVSNKELIVIVKDKNGEEVGYTTVSAEGDYSMSGVPPGEYIVMVDKDYQKYHKIKPTTDSVNKIVEIPPEYKKFVDVKGVNLKYIYNDIPTI